MGAKIAKLKCRVRSSKSTQLGTAAAVLPPHQLLSVDVGLDRVRQLHASLSNQNRTLPLIHQSNVWHNARCIWYWRALTDAQLAQPESPTPTNELHTHAEDYEDPWSQKRFQVF